MIITKFDKTHLHQLKKLSDNLFEKGWTLAQFESELENSYSKSYIMLYDNQVIGFIFAKILYDEMEILNIGIDKQFQGKKYGKMLLEKMLNYAKENQISKVFLEVNTSNNKAINLYSSFGFITNRVRKNYYDNQDALELIKIL